MAWPPSDIPTGNTDAGTDNPQVARADILGLMQGFNLLRNHFSTFMRGLAEAVDAPAARTALGASAVGSNVFTAADAAAARTALGASTVGGNVFTASDGLAARTAIGAAAAADTVNLTGAQTVAGLKTFSDGVRAGPASPTILFRVRTGTMPAAGQSAGFSYAESIEIQWATLYVQLNTGNNDWVPASSLAWANARAEFTLTWDRRGFIVWTPTGQTAIEGRPFRVVLAISPL